MEWPEGVGEILEALVAGVREALGDNLVGMYVKGSLATGDFDPETSDVDFFAVTERPLSEAEYERLRELHGRLAGSANRYGRELEGPYLYKEAARRYRPGERHPTAYRGEEFGWSEHMANWLLERKMVRE